MAAGARHELRTGCRRGNPAALDALLYACADGTYAMALAAMSDEETAQECVREAWRRTLASLHRWRFDSNPHHRVRRVMFEVIAQRAGLKAARAAERAAQGPDGALGMEGVRLPEQVLEELSQLGLGVAPSIRAAQLTRGRAYRAALAGLAVLAVLIWTVVLVRRAQQSQSLAQLKYECLRTRVIEQDLVSAVRELSRGLEDPAGADQVTAADCERVTLVLEEVANSQSLADLSGLRFIRQRILKHELAEFVRLLAEEGEELSLPLRRVALVLEEVENL